MATSWVWLQGGGRVRDSGSRGNTESELVLRFFMFVYVLCDLFGRE